MQRYEYESYEQYKTVQIVASKRTKDWVWGYEEGVKFIADHLSKKCKNMTFGLCHGSRAGKEQEWFTKYLNIEVLGTDISDIADQYPNTIEWDFHNIKREWEGNVDFVYSNSIDHAYDPKLCLFQWMRCLKPGGYCILHWEKGHLHATKRDPFGASVEEYKYLILSEGYNLVEINIDCNERNVFWIKQDSG